MKKLKDLKAGDKFYYVNNRLGVRILTATNVLNCISNERLIKVEMKCNDARWSSIYGWRESSSLCDDGGAFYFDKAEVVNLLHFRNPAHTMDFCETIRGFKIKILFLNLHH